MKYKNNTEKDVMVNMPSTLGKNTEWVVVGAGCEADLTINEEYAAKFGLDLMDKVEEKDEVEVKADESELSGAEGSIKVETKKKKRGKK